jgi:hypothetical protein
MMRELLISALLICLFACRRAETSPLSSFQASHSIEIQNETKDLVLKSHNSFHTGCLVKAEALNLIDFRTILAKNDSEDYISTSVIRWEVRGCAEPYFYETQIQRIRRHQDSAEKNYGISIQPVYGIRVPSNNK